MRRKKKSGPTAGKRATTAEKNGPTAGKDKRSDQENGRGSRAREQELEHSKRTSKSRQSNRRRARGSRLANDLGRRDHVRGSALEQSCELDEGLTRPLFIDEVVESRGKTPQDSEDHGDSTVAVHQGEDRCH